MSGKIKLWFLLCFAMFLLLQLPAQIDSVRMRQLPEVEILGNGETVTTAVPIQTINAKELKALPILQLSDALKYMSGIVIRDYGGVGGMKTVSVRGLGAQHTGVAYDGIALTDCQTGQIDLGKISTENVKTLSLQNGREEDIFVPARLFSTASLINIVTNEPTFKESKPVNLYFAFTGGSFGLINPFLLIENRIKKKKNENDSFYAWSLKVNYLQSKGDYPFELHYGTHEGDSVSLERRSNSDVRMINAEANFYAVFNSHSKLTAKVYYYLSHRGLPGAVIFYNVGNNQQRLNSQNAFVQLHYDNYFSEKVAYQLNAKYNDDQTRYMDSHYLNTEGKLDNFYHQQEYYLSNSVLCKPFKQWHLSLSNDLFYNTMNANLKDFAMPGRFNCLTSLATTFYSKYVHVSANLLHTLVLNYVKVGEAASNESHWSPSLGINIYPIGNQNFNIRLLYKNIFRMPSFNDLYYREMGNIQLNPEKTNQFDIGLAYDNSWLGRISLSTSVDAYYNRVKDKIVAIPNRNMFIWSMMNFGKVNIAGCDVNVRLNYKIIKHLKINLMGNYSYQHAVDMTDEKSKTYGHQIPYTPRHSGSAAINVETTWFTVGYSILAAGERYVLAQNTLANRLEPYFDQSIYISHDFNVKDKVILGLKLEMLNLANEQYEIIRNYPMQGRSFHVKFTLKY